MRSPNDRSITRLIIGVAVIAIGILFTLDNVGVLRASLVLKFWPVVLLAIGAPYLTRASISEKFNGILLITLGVLILLRNLDVLTFSLWRLWPVILVVFGIRLVLNALQERHGIPGSAFVTDVLDEWAAFGGVERKVQSPAFQGGSVSAFCGGFEIDLRNSQIVSSPVTINVFALCGGGDIRIPEDWDVSVNVLPILGGSDDQTVHPPIDTSTGPRSKLIVTGLAIMGGVSVKN